MDILRPLGDSGLLLTPIGLGTVKLGRNTGVKYPRPFDLPSDEQVAHLLRTAADLGINLIDTAPAYGVSEARLGETLTRHNWFGSRDRWIISTKAGEEFDAAGSRFDFSAAAIEASVQRSLTRLRTDYLDIVFIHSDGRDEAIIADGAAIHALQSLKSRGVIRAIGMSIKSPAGGFAAIGAAPPPDPSGPPAPSPASAPAPERVPPGGPLSSPASPPRWCDALMCTLNASYTDELPLIRECHRRGVGILIKKAFQSGHATSSAANPAAIDPVAAAVAFVFQHAGPAATSIVTGTLNSDHLRHNVAAARAALALA